MPDACAADRRALFLDFDGTLVDIAPTPDAVQVPRELPRVLMALHDRMGGALALVSGRPVAALDAFLAPFRFDAAGLHGTEMRIGGIMVETAAPDSGPLREAAATLAAALAGVPGVLVEDKGRSVALHWRLAPDAREEVVALAERTAARLGPAWRLQHGKDVVEILPASASKGLAIARFLAVDPYRGRTPVFAGDDVTDEHGFAAVLDRGGIAVRIGDGPTIAPHRLASPAALLRELSAWAAGGRIGPGD